MSTASGTGDISVVRLNAQDDTVFGEWYSSSMKVKTSVTLSEELLKAISAETDAQNRSAFIETAIWDYLDLRRKANRDRLEIDLINANAEGLNAEARDASDYQDDQ